MTRATFLLGVGAAAGIMLAAAGILDGAGQSGRLAADAAATVAGQVIRRLDYERMLNAVAGDKRSPLTVDDRRHVLDRMIEEELLVLRALDLGLARVDSRVRRDLTAAMLDAIVADAQSVAPGDDELRAFYAEHQDLFAGADQMRVRQIWFRIQTLADADAALGRAREAERRLAAGEPFATVHRELGDSEIVALPDSLMPGNKLADYLGPTALRAIADIATGGRTAPVRSSSGYHLIELLERAPAPPPPFEAAREQVLEALRRRRADDALREYLDDLRSDAEVVIAADLP